MLEPTSNPIVSSLQALVVAIGNAAVTFSVFGSTEATKYESIAVALIALAYPFVNAWHNHTATHAKTAAKQAAVARETALLARPKVPGKTTEVVGATKAAK